MTQAEIEAQRAHEMEDPATLDRDTLEEIARKWQTQTKAKRARDKRYYGAHSKERNKRRGENAKKQRARARAAREATKKQEEAEK